MATQSWVDILVGGPINAPVTDGPTLTAAAAASCIPTPNKITLPNNFWSIGKVMRLFLMGRISCAVTTPGTARFDIRTGGVTVFDTQALNLNIVAKTNVPFWLEIMLTCRTVGAGTATTLFGLAKFTTEAIVGAPANGAGGNGVLCAPVGAPAVGTGFDNTTANTLDVFFTQTVSTGSLTVHQYVVEAIG
jgi:hypothetical protein